MTVEARGRRRLERNREAVSARLAATRLALGLPTSSVEGSVDHILRDLLSEGELPEAVRSTIAVLAAVGSYPTQEQQRELTGWVAARATDEAMDLLDRWAARSSSRALARILMPAPRMIVDVTRTSRAIETSGIPRVARALAGEALARGAGVVVWEGGVPGAVQLAEDRSVAFPPDVWKSAGRLKGQVARTKRLYWGAIRQVSLLPGGQGLARWLRSWTAPIGNALSDRAGPTTGYLLVDCDYISPEVNRPESVTRLLAWRSVHPSLRTTVVLHDFLPLETPAFFAPDQRVEHVDFARFVADCDRVVVASAHLVPRVEGVRLLFGATRPSETSVVPYGVDARSWPTRPIAKRSGAEFVMVGSMEERKNHALALRALGMLAGNGRQLTLHVVGSARPVHRETQKSLAFARHQGVVVIEHRGVGDDVIRGLMANCVASMYLSWAEGYGLPVLESLALGVPVIASDTPPNREHAIYGGVLLTPPDRPDELARLLGTFLDDPDLQVRLRASIDADALPLGYVGWEKSILG